MIKPCRALRITAPSSKFKLFFVLGRIRPGVVALLLQALEHGLLRSTAEHVRISQGEKKY